MATPAQVLANRQNSLHSTGPRSTEGRAASSRNAAKHNLTSKQIVLPGEDPAEYDELRQDMLDTYKPANATERTLVEELSASSWRLMRARRQETIILTKLAGDNPDPDAAIAAFFLEKPKEIARLTRYITSFERAFYRALNKLEKLQKERREAERRAAIEASAFAQFMNERQLVESTLSHSPIGFVSQNPFEAPLAATIASGISSHDVHSEAHS